MACASRLAFACLLPVAFTLFQQALAQPATTPSPATAQGPTQDKTPDIQNSSTQTTAPATPRERRAQAYAKLLEGQRYMTGLRSGISTSLVRLAQQSFQQAATLDPTLAEAHTALAELAFFYPPQDFPQSEREAAIATRLDANNVGAHRLLSHIHAIKSGLKDNQLEKKAAEQAIAELREVARLDPTDPEAWALLGEFYYAMGKYS